MRKSAPPWVVTEVTESICVVYNERRKPQENGAEAMPWPPDGTPVRHRNIKCVGWPGEKRE
jgi:hypothetical protein